MRATADIDRFASDPVGACVVADSWIHWCARPELFGVLLWGRPSGDSVRALIRSLRVELRPTIQSHRSLVDASRVDGVDATAFELLAGYVREQHARLATQVTRLALVRPGGFAGASVAGFYEVLAPPYPVEVFDDARGALSWLDAGADHAWLDELEQAHRELTSVSPLIASLRAVIVDRLLEVDIGAAARALGLSARTLQRRLMEDGTTFQQELAAARIREAQRRMRDSDAPLTEIAHDVGFTSIQHFSTQFRRAVGLTPSEWRASGRPGR